MWLGPVQLDQFSHIIKEPGSIHPLSQRPWHTGFLSLFLLFYAHSMAAIAPGIILSIQEMNRPCLISRAMFPQMPSMSDLSPHLIDSCDTRSLSVQSRLNRCPPQPEVKTKQTKTDLWGAGEMSQWTRVWISRTQVKAWIIMQASVTAVLLRGDGEQEKPQRVIDQLSRLTQKKDNKERESNKVKGEGWHPRLSFGPRMRTYTPNWGSCGISDNMFSWKFS